MSVLSSWKTPLLLMIPQYFGKPVAMKIKTTTTSKEAIKLGTKSARFFLAEMTVPTMRKITAISMSA